MNNELKIGFSEVDFTPDRPARLAGQFAERISEYVESPISATAMAVEAGREQFVICSCDIVSVSRDLLLAVRQRLEGNNEGLDPQKVILNATHTHTSLLYPRTSVRRSVEILQRFMPEKLSYVPHDSEVENVLSPEEARELLVERITQAVMESWQARKPGTIANAFGRAAVGMNRRVVYNDGTAAMWGDTNLAAFEHLEGGNDSGIELLFVFDKSEQLEGIVANIACPAQCVQHRRFISSDYWGDVKKHLRTAFGPDLKLLALCGPGGDQCPVDMVRWVQPETSPEDPNIERDDPPFRKADPSMFDVSGKAVAARRIAREIRDVFENKNWKTCPAPTVKHRALNIRVPIRRVTPTEMRAARQAIEDYFRTPRESINFNDNARLHVHAGIIARYEFQHKHDLHEFESHIIRLGDIAFATNPFELFLDFGNQIKARSPAAQTFLVQLACGSDGYVPTARAERGGHYSAYVSSGLTGHQGGDILVRETLSCLRELFE